MQLPEFDCQSCGACCSFKWSWPIFKRNRSDAANIPDWMKRDDYPLMKTDEECRCIALEGSVGDSVRCGVYEVRPEACRRFKPGSQLCLEARKAKGL